MFEVKDSDLADNHTSETVQIEEEFDVDIDRIYDETDAKSAGSIHSNY